MRFGIIGYQHAHISRFIREMLELGHDFIGVYEKEMSPLVESLIKKYNVPFYDKLDSLLSRGLDIAGTSAINNEKIDIIELCSKNGIHIMVDKPAVTSEQGFKRLRKVIETNNIKVGMMLTERYNPLLISLKKLIDDNQLGNIVSIMIIRARALNPSIRPGWFYSKVKNGGPIIDLLDIARWLTCSEFSRHKGVMLKNMLHEYPDFYNYASVQSIMENESILHCTTDWHIPEWSESRCICIGNKGMCEIMLSGLPFNKEDKCIVFTDENSHINKVKGIDPEISLCGDFINKIKNQSTCITDNDIIKSVEATILADENSEIIVRDY